MLYSFCQFCFGVGNHGKHQTGSRSKRSRRYRRRLSPILVDCAIIALFLQLLSFIGDIYEVFNGFGQLEQQKLMWLCEYMNI